MKLYVFTKRKEVQTRVVFPRNLTLYLCNLVLALSLTGCLFYLLIIVVPSVEWANFGIVPARPIYLHYVRFNGSRTTNRLRFTEYLSVRSAVQYLAPTAIFLHGDFVPTGTYWENLTSEGLIEHVQMEKPTDFGIREGKPKLPYFTEHEADLAKLEILLKHGGIAADFDAYFLRGEKIKQILRQKKAITCYGDEDGNNIGFVAGWQDSIFLKAWRRSYKDLYVGEDWNFNQAFVSKYLTALFPNDVFVADHVCVIRFTENEVAENSPELKDFMSPMAIHTYNRHGKVDIESSEDLQGNTTYRKHLLRTIYHHLKLPEVDKNFRDEVKIQL